MSFIHRNLWTVLLCGVGDPSGAPLEGLIRHFTHTGSLAQHAAHHGLTLHTAAMTAAAAGSAAAASSAAVHSAAVVGVETVTAAYKHGRAWGIRAACTAMVVATAAWLSLVSAATETATLVLASLPRTLRAARWATRAALSYRKFAQDHAGEDTDSDAYQDALGQLHSFWARKLLAVCRANGGVYIKAGQFASAFGAVPREFRVELAGLEDRAIPRPYDIIYSVIASELGPGSRALFTEFEENATAAASLAQVHKAQLADGTWVAVKVQYPGLAARVAADLAVLRVFNLLAAAVFPSYKLAWLVDELEAKLSQELDFRTEIANASRVADLLRGHKFASVPRMHTQLCSPRLLVMDWVDGCKISEKAALQAKGISPRAVGLQLVKLFGELTMLHGFMHGDPHAGNLMVRPKGNRRSMWRWLFRGSRRSFEIVLLDHGTYLDLPPDLREQFCQLWCAFVLQDSLLQADLCTAVAGERGPAVLPVLLTQSARNKAEERAVRKAAGIASVGDMAALLQTAPRAVVEVLRINTVIRSISAHLGVSMGERKRILAGYARQGLPARGDRGKHVHTKFTGAMCRAQLMLTLGAWQGAAAIKEVSVRAWSLVLGMWADVLYDV